MGGIAGHTCIGGSQPRGSWVVAGRGRKMSLYLAKRACPMGERNADSISWGFSGCSQVQAHPVAGMLPASGSVQALVL